MRTALSRLALVSALARPSPCAAAFAPTSRGISRSTIPLGQLSRRTGFVQSDGATALTRRHLSTFNPEAVEIARVNKEGLEEILNEIGQSGREESGYVVIDVRNEDEIAMTGKISEHAETLPLPIIAMNGAFNLDDEEWEDAFGFPKPSMDETIVFSCKAGIRSYQAAQFAAMAGYTSLINYTGGADEWFR